MELGQGGDTQRLASGLCAVITWSSKHQVLQEAVPGYQALDQCLQSTTQGWTLPLGGFWGGAQVLPISDGQFLEGLLLTSSWEPSLALDTGARLHLT